MKQIGRQRAFSARRAIYGDTLYRPYTKFHVCIAIKVALLVEKQDASITYRITRADTVYTAWCTREITRVYLDLSI